MIQVDKNIPIPILQGKQPIYPWKSLSPGDSFFVPGKRSYGKDALPTTIGKKTFPGSTWTTRNIIENGVAGVRVWRIS
jgi:hypothetical protein